MIVAKNSHAFHEKRDALTAQKKAVNAELSALFKELDEIYNKLGAKVEKKDEVSKEESKKKNQELFDKLDQEWKDNQAKIDELKKKKDDLFKDFKEKQKEFKEFASANNRWRAASFALKRKEEEAEEAELAKKEEEELLKRHPFEKEMDLCDTLIAYLIALQTKEAKTEAAKATKEVVVPEGMTLLKKEEEDYFVAEPKKSKKSKKNAKAEKKDNNIIHNFSTLESFATVRVTAPKVIDEVSKCLELVKSRKEFFNTLPRGSNIDEELAKL